MQDLTSVHFQIFEVAHNLAHGIHDGEGIGITAADPCHRCRLGLIDHADEHALFLAGVHTLGRDQGGGVTGFADDFLGNFLRMLGNDLETDGFTAGLHQPVNHGRGKISVDDAQNHRLHLVIVDEVTANGDAGIHNEADAVNRPHGIALMYDGGNKIRTAGIGAGLHQNRKHITLNHTRNQGAQDLTGAVGRFVGKAGQIQPLQHDQKKGEGRNIQHAPHRDGLAHLKIGPQSQGDVDQQAQIAHIDAEDMLDHGADTVEACGSEAVAENKKLIAECIEQSQTDDQQIGHGFFAKFHGTHSRTLLKQRPKTDFCFNLIYHIPPARSR